MNFKCQKTFRFHDEEKQIIEPIEKQLPLFKPPPPLLKSGLPSDKSNKTRQGIPRFRRFRVFPENYETETERERDKILDPGGDVVFQWNKIFLFWCLVGLFVDPLFFYLPKIQMSGKSSCITTDLKLEIIVTVFRTLADMFYVLNIVIKFRTAYVSPSSRVFGRGELVKDPKLIARRYLRSDFIIDLIASLPLPQIVIWFSLPSIRRSQSGHANSTLIPIVLVQYLPRLYLIFPLSFEMTKATGVVARTAWAGAAYNLLLYMLASHIVGAVWYLLTVERYATCWKSECDQERTPLPCHPEYLDCSTSNSADRMNWLNSTSVFNNCDASNTSISFNFGVFESALSNNAPSDPFAVKYFFCLWFGLQSLSSSGNNMITSDFIVESVFATLVVILSLILFAHLIGNMQTYLQSTTVRLEEWRLKRRDTEEWMRHRQLPHHLRERVRRFNQYKWVATRGVNEESILRSLPYDLRRDIQRHLRLDLVRRVTFFSQMDDQLLDAICERLVSSLSTQGTYMVREGDPVTEMLFIIRGKLESSTTNGGRTGFFNSITLKPGDYCGEELLSWALLPNSTVNLPSSTRTVKAIEETEAFALQAEDLKFVANQFRRLHSKTLQHTFRYYSYHWRTWAACFIQAAWRRCKRRMLAKRLSLAELFSSYNEEFTVQEMVGHEVRMQNSEGSSTSNMKRHLGVTMLASRAAKNSWRVAQKVKEVEMPMLQKPHEPDFSVAPDEDLRLI